MDDQPEPTAPKPTSRPNLDDIPELLRRKIIEQGVAETANVEYLTGRGKDLWASDEEFEAFLAFLRESRKY